jgi:hypothetical protein
MIFRDFLPMNESSGEHTLLSTAQSLYINNDSMSTQDACFSKTKKCMT